MDKQKEISKDILKMAVEMAKEQIGELKKELEEKTKLLESFNKELEQLEQKPFKPTCWEDLQQIAGYYPAGFDCTAYCYFNNEGVTKSLKNVFPEEKQAEAVLALAQLLQLAKHEYWNGDWKPDWEDFTVKYGIWIREKNVVVFQLTSTPKQLVFKTKEKAQEFLESYPELIEQAKVFL